MSTLHKAQPTDLKLLQAFLIENKLKPSVQINASSIYYCAKHNEQIIGTIGAEFNNTYALIRAAGIAPQWRKQGIAKKLFIKLYSDLEKKGITHFYLFSRQAAEFWKKMGFVQCTIQEVIDVLPDAPQVKEFVADNSIWTDVAWHKPAKSNKAN